MPASLILVLVTTAVSHLIPPSFNNYSAPALLERAAPITSLKVAEIKGVGKDAGACDATQVRMLKDFISEAAWMLENGAQALARNGVEASPAYRAWFGKQKSVTTRAIRTHNFKATLESLRLPLRGVSGSLTPGQLDPNAVTFTCWPKDSESCREKGTLAETINPEAGRIENPPRLGFDPAFTGTLIGVCPLLFQLRKLNKTLETFSPNSDSTALIASAPMTIVHEMQHVARVTGMARFCDDHSYSPLV